MSQSLSKIYLHIIFHVKEGCRIHGEDLAALHAYISGILIQKSSVSLCVGGIHDHVHVLCTLPRIMSVADLVRYIKASSSHWLSSQRRCYSKFGWQNGYAVFSVSQSQVEKVKKYIGSQAEHHKKVSCRDEYISFLKLYDIDYDEKYLFDDPRSD